jgi:hypothetical protein
MAQTRAGCQFMNHMPPNLRGSDDSARKSANAQLDAYDRLADEWAKAHPGRPFTKAVARKLRQRVEHEFSQSVD